eukprot:TRINITY_DN8021_c0_g1_i1.p1 TRINITY_DN8021_c0_g1~~TRINITY_DN8021_c0_g1_i1.p1  ORF type:complete len:248 (+),score=34.94 TRINITY_DN8021_c0_g1_i1:64-807(+)
MAAFVWKSVRRLATATAVLRSEKASLLSSCPDPGKIFTEVPRALWPLLSFHAELEQTGAMSGSLDAIKWYTDPTAANYRSLNRLLRHSLDAKVPKEVDAIDELLALSPAVASPGLLLWRGFASTQYALHLQSLLKEKTEAASGSINASSILIEDRAYMSCSVLKSVGNFYARRHAILPEDLDDSVLMRIKVPAGAQVLCVACAHGGVEGEEEILLPRGSTIRIDDIVPKKSSTDVLLAEATLVLNDG